MINTRGRTVRRQSSREAGRSRRTAWNSEGEAPSVAGGGPARPASDPGSDGNRDPQPGFEERHNCCPADRCDARRPRSRPRNRAARLPQHDRAKKLQSTKALTPLRPCVPPESPSLSLWPLLLAGSACATARAVFRQAVRVHSGPAGQAGVARRGNTSLELVPGGQTSCRVANSLGLSGSGDSREIDRPPLHRRLDTAVIDQPFDNADDYPFRSRAASCPPIAPRVLLVRCC